MAVPVTGRVLPAAAAVPRRRRRALVWTLLVLALLALVSTAALATLGGAYRSSAFPDVATAPDPAADGDPGKRAERAHQRLRAALPRGTYIVVDSYRNHLRVYRDGELLRDALCSTGSGVVLRDPRSGRQWVFDTPAGERRIQRKVKNPIWAKPDWAFIEEGYEPPPPGARDRFDDFSLGDYGLYMGDGYIIHGTIFQTLLGQRVTHGCIRLGDKDLEFAYREVPLGARVYLY